jgi:hypothetical protein
MILAYRVVLRTICADLRYDFTVPHETNSLPGNKMYVVRLKKFSIQKNKVIFLKKFYVRKIAKI